MPDRDKLPAPGEYFMLWILMAQTKDAILRARERDYARYGISNERRAVLYIIENNGGRPRRSRLHVICSANCTQSLRCSSGWKTTG
jgi:hypothetical protein